MSWTPNDQDAWYLLQLSENGRPEEQISQFIASMIECGGMDLEDTLEFFGRVMKRTRELLNNEGEIWPQLLPMGNMVPTIPPWQEAAERWEELVQEVVNEEADYDTILERAQDYASDPAHSVEARPKPKQWKCEPIYVLGQHLCDYPCWMVLGIESGRFGYWRPSGYMHLWVTDPFHLNPNDLIRPLSSEPDWIDVGLTLSEARKRLEEETTF